MVSRNGDSVSFTLGIIGGIIGLISLIVSCIGVGLPSWYIGTNANNTIILAQTNLFSSCYTPNATQNTSTGKFTCVSFNSFSCSIISYQNSALNTTAYLSGCTNPNIDAVAYSDFDAPIYQTSVDSFYRLRAAAVLSIIFILFTFFSVIFGFIAGICVLNIYLVFIAPILACFAVIFGVCCLATAGSVINCTGTGFALFVAGVSLAAIASIFLSLLAGRLSGLKLTRETNEDESAFIPSFESNAFGRRVVQKRKA